MTLSTLNQSQKQALVAVIGGGLAGSEAALQLAKRGIAVDLYEMKPETRSPAHHSLHLAEIVCSNSFGNLKTSTASGLLKAELLMLDCQLIQTAHRIAVPAGNALAVDRDQFAQTITEMVEAQPLINLVCQDVQRIPDEQYEVVIIATGPLTSTGLVSDLQQRLEQEQLYFFDAAAPILTKDSINFDVAFIQDRYNQSQSGDTTDGTTEAASYINCPLNQPEYEALIQFILAAQTTQAKAFEQNTAFFESCLPIEILASRGLDTPRYGPMKPVGLIDPRTGKQPWAVVQLRQDNMEGTLYNMVGFQTNLKWGEQKEMIQLIPGLEEAEVVRYGVMHRNTFINSPTVLQPTMQLRAFPKVLVAGQLTGVEGYTESIASGLMASLSAVQLLGGTTPQSLPKDTMMGALFHYITRPEVTKFQPINSNWGILPTDSNFKPPKGQRKNKLLRNAHYAKRCVESLKQFIETHQLPLQLPSPPVIEIEAPEPFSGRQREGRVRSDSRSQETHSTPEPASP